MHQGSAVAEAVAVVLPAPKAWLIRDNEGRYLRARFDGQPDWACLKCNGRRHTWAEAQDAVASLAALGVWTMVDAA